MKKTKKKKTEEDEDDEDTVTITTPGGTRFKDKTPVNRQWRRLRRHDNR